MPQTITLGVFTLGAVLLLLALTSGGFKIFGAEMSGASGRWTRAIAAILGLGLIGVAVLPGLPALPGLRGGAGASPTAEPASNAPVDVAANPPAAVATPHHQKHPTPAQVTPTQSPAQTPPPRTVVATPPPTPSALPAGELIDGQDSVQILNVNPPPGSFVLRGSARLFHLTLAYYLQSADQAIMSISVAQIPNTAAGCSSPRGQLTDATQVDITRGRHTIDVDVSWSGDSSQATKGNMDYRGYLKFVPMFWHGTDGHRSDRFAVFNGYDAVCMTFGA